MPVLSNTTILGLTPLILLAQPVADGPEGDAQKLCGLVFISTGKFPWLF